MAMSFKSSVGRILFPIIFEHVLSQISTKLSTNLTNKPTFHWRNGYKIRLLYGYEPSDIGTCIDDKLYISIVYLINFKLIILINGQKKFLI